MCAMSGARVRRARPSIAASGRQRARPATSCWRTHRRARRCAFPATPNSSSCSNNASGQSRGSERTDPRRTDHAERGGRRWLNETNLGQALISLVRDLEPGLLLLVSALCYVLALAAFAQGLLRLLKTSEDKFHAPSGGGTALSFLICIVMASLPTWLSAAGESLFGSGTRPAAASLGYGARGADYDALLAAVFTLVSLVGLFAFIRGAFTLRAAADGKVGANGPKAFAHMAGGIAAWHIVAVIEAMQTSLGIAVLNIR